MCQICYQLSAVPPLKLPDCSIQHFFCLIYRDTLSNISAEAKAKISECSKTEYKFVYKNFFCPIKPLISP